MLLWLPPKRAVRGAISPSISWQATDADGEPADPSGTVTVAVTDSEGNAVSGVGTVSGTGTDPRAATLPATAVADIDWLTATWSLDGTVIYSEIVEVVGGTICTYADLTSNSNIPAADQANMRSARLAIEDIATRIMHRSPFLRFYTERIDGTGQCWIRPSWPDVQQVVWANIWTGTSSTALTAQQIANIVVDESGRVVRSDGASWPCGAANIELGYRFGMQSVPNDLRTELIRAVRAKVGQIKTSGIPDRATSMSTFDGVNYALATPGMGRWSTGLPDVDEKLNGYAYRALVA